jgi:PAS domain S-box-containing protein
MGRGFYSRLAISLGLIVVLLIGNAWLGYHNTRQLNEAAALVVHTQEVMDALEELVSTTKDAQTGERGYIITGETRYLEPYDAATAAMDEKIQRLKRLTQDNPQQQARIPSLQKCIHDELDILQQNVALGKKDLEAARRAVMTGAGKKALDEIRFQVGEMKQQEQDLLCDQKQRSRSNYQVAVATGFVAALLALGMIGAVTLLLRRHLLARMQAAAVLHEQQEWFRTTLGSIGDAVIATDAEGRVKFLNGVAQSLTGWSDQDAIEQPLVEVFHIINEKSRERCEDPVAKVLESGVVVGLANHTALINKNGAETSIADSGAPIRDANGRVIGVVLVFRDITEQNRADEALRDSEERLRFALEGIGAGEWDLDLMDHTAYRSLRHDQIFGYEKPLPQWTYEMFLEHVSPEDRKLVDQKFRQAVEAMRDWDFECRIVRCDMAVRWIRACGRPIRDGSGIPRHLVGIVQDITDRKLAEQAVWTSEKRYRGLVELSPDAILINRNNRFTFANPAALRLFGASSANQLLGKSPFDLFHPDYHEIIRTRIQQLLDGQLAVLVEEKVVRLDGAAVDVEVAAASFTDQEGQGIQVILRDIADRKRADEELRLNEARLQALVQLNQMASASLQEITDFALESAVALTNSKIGYLAFMNEDESVLTMHSWSKTAMQECAIIDKPIVYQVVNTGLWGEAVRQRKPVFTNDYQAPNPLKKGHPDGHVKVLRHMNAPIFDGDRIVIVAGVGNKAAPYDDSDVRQLTLLMQGMWQLIRRKRQEEEIRHAHDELEIRVQERTAELAQTNVQLSHAKDAAEAASLAKSTFLANMSHEIRTPLNAVIGMTELVLKSPLSAQQREFLHTVKDSGEALLSVINDILDFSKIEAGKLALDCSTFDLRESLGDTMKSFAIRAHQQGLELACFIHPEVPHMVVGDYSRLRQIVVNLVGNAIKFTETGEVSLEVTRESRTEKDVVLHFVVADTGIGIPPEKQTAIFEMFEQADASTTRRHGGTGLGLAIAARLIGLMGGRLWVESEVGRGSRFHFIIRLDLADDEPAEPLPPEPASLHRMRVLVVDDNATNRRILEEVLHSWQMVPVTAPSAAAAIKLMLEAWQEGQPYRLVLTDAHMPRVDGFMLAEQIKQDSAMGSTVVMMLTSGDRPEDMQRCEELGISAYLLKPIKQSELLEAIELALGITVPKVKSLATAAQPKYVGNLHILLAEDSLVNQKVAVALLEGQGHKVTVVNNGREAIAALQTEKFDMVLMDVQMPEMDGLEATEKIRVREQPTGTHIPIIAMTAHALKGDRERCLAAGMDGYISKPIHVTELFNVIDGLFAPSAEYAEQPIPEIAEGEEGETVNWNETLQALGGNLKLLKTVVEAALVEIPRLMKATSQAISSSDAAALRLAAHTLKGVLRYFGKTMAFEEVLRLERMGQDGSLAEAGASLATLESEILRIVQVLQKYLQRNPMSNDS